MRSSAVLEAAEAAAARGLWVAGFVSYEAAPGLDPALVVRPRDPEDAFAALPLAWFAMFERAEETTLPLPRDDGGPGGRQTARGCRRPRASGSRPPSSGSTS